MSNSKSISSQARLKQLLDVERNDLFVAVIYSAGIGIFTLALPVATQALVNTIALGNLMQPLLLLSVLVFATLAASGVLQVLRFYVVENIQRRIFVRISSDTIHRLLRAPASAFESYHGPELVNRFFDVVTLQKSGATLLLDGLSVVMQTGMGMILLAFYHPWLLAFAILLLGAILFVIFPLGSGAVATSIEESKTKYALVAWLQETARFPFAFRPPDATNFAIGRTDELVTKYLRNRATHFRILLRQIMGTFTIHALASSALLGVGGWLVIQRQLTLGQLVAAEIVVQLVLSGFSKLGKHLEVYYDLAAAVDKLGYLQDLPLENQGIVPIRGSEKPFHLKFHQTAFGYSGNQNLLQGVDLEVLPGQRIGLTGQSGAGKSTLFDLALAYRRPTQGSVELNGESVADIRRDDLRNSVMLVRSPEIFEGTILENLLVGRDIDLAEVRQALRQVSLLDRVEGLRDGLETRLTTGGVPLSGGQAVRLAIARAILGKPRLLLIDESLDHIHDAPGIESLLDVLFDRNAGWTLVIASSHPSLLARCDFVYELNESGVKPLPITHSHA
jgi:ABC-type bacteriocin/lantibiotic exporter with double-glycine peptidase domain